MAEAEDQTVSEESEDKKLKSKVNKVRPSARRVFLDPSTPSVRSILRVVIVVLIVLAIAGFLQTIIGSLTKLFFIIVLSVFFAYFIEPLIRLIQTPFEKRTGRFLPRPLAIATAYLIVFGGIGLAIYTLAPLVVQQAQDLGANLPSLVSSAQSQITSFNKGLQRYRIPPQIQEQINERMSLTVEAISSYVTTFIGSAAISIVSFLPWMILIPILAFFFLKDVNVYRLTVLRIFPSGNWRGRVEEILTEVNGTLRAYTRAQLLSCLLIGVICTTGFYLLGLNYALLLGVLAGFFEFIPLIGPLTIGILATSVAGFSNSPQHALFTAIFLLVLRIIHDYVTYPRIVRGGIHLHPLAIILSVLAGEQVAGIPGVFLSIPIVAIGTVFYKHLVEHRGEKGLLSGLLEPKKEETSARLVEDKSVAPDKIDEKVAAREEEKEEVKELVKDAVKEVKNSNTK